MVTTLFTDERVLKSLLQPWEWHIVSSLFHPRIPPEVGRDEVWLLRSAKQHRHRHKQIVFVLRGQGYFRYGDKTYIVRPGTVFLYDSHEEHACEVLRGTDETDLMRVNVFPGRVCSRLWSYRDGINVNPHEKEEILTDSEIAALLDDHWTAAKERTGISDRVSLSRFLCSLGLLAAALAERYMTGHPVERRQHREVVVGAMQDHIRNSLGKGDDLDKLARRAGYSKFHLSHIFREQTGQSIHQYLNTCRIARARDLLNQGFHQKEVAVAIGFASEKSFWLWRKKQRARGFEI